MEKKRIRSPSPSISPALSPSHYSDVNISIFHKYRFLIPDGATMSNIISGIFGGVFGLLGYFKLASFFIMLGFFFDAFDGPVARYFECVGEVGMYLDNLAGMVTFGVAVGQLLLSYLKDDLLIGIGVALFHIISVTVRLAVFMTEEGLLGLYRGIPISFAGVLITCVCASGLPNSYVAILSVINSSLMIMWDTIYVKPFSVSKKPVAVLVWFLYGIAFIGVATFTSLGNLVVALIPFIYGIIPVIQRSYRWLFRHSKYPGKFDYAMTCGVFDLFHSGHYELFVHLSFLGRKVYAAVHDDESVFLLKHIRVTDPAEVRMDNISKQRRVKKVFAVRNTDPSDVFREMIRAIPPGKTACFMRGDDWMDFPGKHVFDENKIPIVYHHHSSSISSTLLRQARKYHTI